MSAADQEASWGGGGRIAFVAGLNLAIAVAEVIGGLAAGSLSLVSDALHSLTDGVALIVAWVALRLKQRPRTDRHTFGLKRAEVLAAVANAGLLLIVSLYLFQEAWHRLQHPEPIAGPMMAAVASVGLVANGLGVWLLHRGSSENMNFRAAYLHLLSDTISSVAVLVGGLAIAMFKVYWIDPLLTVLIGLYVLKQSIAILWRSLGVFMLAAPPTVPLDQIRTALLGAPGVIAVHHLHLWEVAEHDVHLEGHVVLQDQLLSEADAIRNTLRQLMLDRFQIAHVTLEIEHNAADCASGNEP
jgi:cobalt-zinc-cadmium efflux system protein